MRVPAPSGIRPNWMAVAALVLGTVGTVFGFMPPMGFAALVSGVLAIVFGYIGIRRAQHGAEHWGMAVAGVCLGVVAIGLGVWGMVIVGQMNELNDVIVGSG